MSRVTIGFFKFISVVKEERKRYDCRGMDNVWILQVESLLNQLSEVNTRYCEVRPAADIAEARVRELEAELEAVKTELNEQKALSSEQEERNKQMYLKMYAKGQEAARLEQADQVGNRTLINFEDLRTGTERRENAINGYFPFYRYSCRRSNRRLKSALRNCFNS